MVARMAEEFVGLFPERFAVGKCKEPMLKSKLLVWHVKFIGWFKVKSLLANSK